MQIIQLSGSVFGANQQQAQPQWWRLINPEWIDPAGLGKMPPENGGKKEDKIGPEATMIRIDNAMKFSHAIKDTFHEETYAHFGADPEQRAWNDIAWRVTEGNAQAAGDPMAWTLLEGEHGDNGKGTIRVLGANATTLTLELQAAAAPGDGTVPMIRSADRVQAKYKFTQTGYDHQGSYGNPAAQAATLYGVVKIAYAYNAAWWEKKN